MATRSGHPVMGGYRNRGTLDGHNVVIHEFIHKLDMLNGAADGFPPQHKRSHAKDWSELFTTAYADFQQNPVKR